eukprot:1161620-Pelagomonas_calceolata.AAC.3
MYPARTSSPNTAMYAPGLECSSGVSALGPSSEAAAPAGSAPVLAATAPAPALVLMEGTAAIAASAAAASTSASGATKQHDRKGTTECSVLAGIH